MLRSRRFFWHQDWSNWLTSYFWCHMRHLTSNDIKWHLMSNDAYDIKNKMSVNLTNLGVKRSVWTSAGKPADPIIFPLFFSKILCIIEVAWAGENLLESIWSFRVFSSNMSIDPQEMGSCCKFDCCGNLGHPKHGDNISIFLACGLFSWSVYFHQGILFIKLQETPWFNPKPKTIQIYFSFCSLHVINYS